MLSSAEGGGLVLVTEDGDEFVGFPAGWIEHEEDVAETSDSNPVWIYLGHLHPLKVSRASELRTSCLKQSSRTLIRLASGVSGSECWRQIGLGGWPMNAQVSNRMK
jgi:8-oxo-dGTP pyrophosphatase MutT (NUDIX family)